MLISCPHDSMVLQWSYMPFLLQQDPIFLQLGMLLIAWCSTFASYLSETKL